MVTLGPKGLFYQGSRGGMYKQRCERLSCPLGGTEVGLAPGGGLVGCPPDGTPAPPKQKMAALSRGPVSSWGWANEAARGAPDTWGSWAWWLVALRGEAWLVIPPMKCRPPPKKKWVALPRGPVSSWVWANNAMNGALGTWGSSAWRLDVLPGGA
jgi:hypothetical protein